MIDRRVLFVFVAIVICVCAFPASGQDFEQAATLVIDNPIGPLSFGRAVAISGDSAVIGSDYEARAWIFVRDPGEPTGWREVTELEPSTWVDGFGEAADIDGDVAVVGDRYEISSTGGAYVFSRHEGGLNAWGESAKLTASDAATFNSFGRAVAVSGDTIAVGAMGNNNAEGTVYVFQRDHGGSGNWGEVVRIENPDPPLPFMTDFFGTAVALDGDLLAVGAGGYDDSGCVYVFERNQGGSNAWGQVIRLVASDAVSNQSFGVSVTIEGERVVVGAHGDPGLIGQPVVGAVYVFERNYGGPNNWGEVAKAMASDGEFFDALGWWVDVSGDWLVASAPFEDEVAEDAGAAYVFNRNHGGIDNWGEVQKLVAADGVEHDEFGQSVSISGPIILVGAPQMTVGNDGKAYVFVRIVFSDGFESGDTSAWSASVP